MSDSVPPGPSADVLEAWKEIDEKYPFKLIGMGKSTAQLVDENDPDSAVVIRDEKGRDRLIMCQKDYFALREGDDAESD